MAPLDLQGVVSRAIDEYQSQAAAKFQAMTTILVEAGVANIVGDEAQLYEAVTNLLSNAIKYTPNEGAITVELAVTPQNEVCYKVQDTGYGIPEDRQSRLFEPFYRSKTAETATIEGTGLGLHLVKNIIERHKGEMVFRSVYREGSTFGFKLPLASKN